MGEPRRGGHDSGLMHRMLERLTGLKLRLSSLRRRARREPIPPHELETVLQSMEAELDTAANLVQTLQAETGKSALPAAASREP